MDIRTANYSKWTDYYNNCKILLSYPGIKDLSHRETVMPYVSNYENFMLRYCIHEDADMTKRGHSGIYCDYQKGSWHYDQLITWIKRHVPTYALSPRELQNIPADELVSKVELAFQMVYGQNAKPDKRGEIGEIILHGLIRDIYGTTPLISKVFYKSAQNDTVKGFDCVHAIVKDHSIDSLWLGEAKFYKDASSAISEAVSSVTAFMQEVKLKAEFITVNNLLDENLEAAKLAKELFKRGTSLDIIFPKVCVPVLITYESPIVKKYVKYSDDFVKELTQEVSSHVQTFMDKAKDLTDIDIHVFFLSIAEKQKIIEQFDKQLKGHQGNA